MFCNGDGTVFPWFFNGRCLEKTWSGTEGWRSWAEWQYLEGELKNDLSKLLVVHCLKAVEDSTMEAHLKIFCLKQVARKSFGNGWHGTCAQNMPQEKIRKPHSAQDPKPKKCVFSFWCVNKKSTNEKNTPPTPFVAQFKESYPPANSPLQGVKQTS